MGCTSSKAGRGSVFSNPLPEISQQESTGISPVKDFTQSPEQRDKTQKAAFVYVLGAGRGVGIHVTKKAALRAGCYWGTEKYMAKSFTKLPGLPPGKLVSGAVGFMGPANAPISPSYEDVCTGKTGHVEVYHFEYTGGDEFFEAAVKYLFQFHDPTTLNRQGNDTGTQYASVIYCFDKAQFDIATRVKEQLQLMLNSGAVPKGTYQSVRVSTDIRMAESPFFPAKQEHQDYLTNNPSGYCNHRLRLQSWPAPQ